MVDYSLLGDLFEVKVGDLVENIYNVMISFGFTEEEIKLILNINNNIEDYMLVDLFHVTHDKLIEDNSELAMELKSKLLEILKSYLCMRKNNSNFSVVMVKTIEEFNDVLAEKYRTSK